MGILAVKNLNGSNYSMTDLQNPLTSTAILLEALLFVAAEPVSPAQLAAALETTTTEVEQGLKVLEESLQLRGLRLQRHASRVQMTSAPEFAEQIERFLGLEATSRLSRAALETLSIIAYQQPVTRPQVDEVRGVNSDSMMKSLLSKGLIHETGRTDGPGRPILYSTTPEFLQHFGLNSVRDLPPLDLQQGVEEQELSVLKG
jgi:segregation and condensation protein B